MMMKKLLFVFLCAAALCGNVWAQPCSASSSNVGGVPAKRINGTWLPQTELFAVLIADPRQVTNGGGLRFNDNVVGKHVGACSFGSEFGVFRWCDFWHSCGQLQFDIEAGVFAVFDLDHMDRAMVNTDFFVAAMFSYARNCWSYRFRLWHLSSHLGDEFLLANPGYDRRNLSDEGVDLFASYQLAKPLRVYAGAGYIFDRDSSFQEHPLYFEWGSEAKIFGSCDDYNRVYIQPFLAMHFRSWEEHDFDVDQTYALGVEWSNIKGTNRKVRAFIQYYEGFSRDGQFVRDRTNYVEIHTTYGF